MEEGRPLVGPSGRVFNAALRLAGLDREEFLVTNLFDEEVPNDTAIHIWKDLSNPLTARSRERLAEEIARVAPTVIVPLGSPALFAFTGHSSIRQLRGAVIAATDVAPGTKLVPTFHPAYILRQYQMLPIMVDDLGKAAREADRGPGIIKPVRRLLLEPSLLEVRQWRDRLVEQGRLVSVDIETAPAGRMMTCIAFSNVPTDAICIPFVDLRQPDRSYWRSAAEEVLVWQAVREIMESPVPKLGQNFSTYDALWLWELYGIATVGLQHDTRLLHHAIYAELPKDLASMGNTYTEQGGWKQWGRAKGDKRDD